MWPGMQVGIFKLFRKKRYILYSVDSSAKRIDPQPNLSPSFGPNFDPLMQNLVRIFGLRGGGGLVAIPWKTNPIPPTSTFFLLLKCSFGLNTIIGYLPLL